MTRTKPDFAIKPLFILFLLLILINFGCGKIEELSRFDVEYTDSLEIPSLVGICLPINIPLQDIPVEVESQLALNDVRKYFVDQAFLDTLILSITAPDYASFNFLKSVHVYIAADDLPELLVAWKEDITDNNFRSLSMEVAGEDLSGYMKKKGFKLRVRAVVDELIVTDHTIQLQAAFSVDAQILGQYSGRAAECRRIIAAAGR